MSAKEQRRVTAKSPQSNWPSSMMPGRNNKRGGTPTKKSQSMPGGPTTLHTPPVSPSPKRTVTAPAAPTRLGRNDPLTRTSNGPPPINLDTKPTLAKHPTPSPAMSPSYVDPMLRRIDEVTNMEIDTKARDHTVAISSTLYYLVLDTNILLGYRDVIDQFKKDSEACGAPVVIIIPGVVVAELDYQKKGDINKELGWNARLASAWILDMLKQRSIVKGQAYHETLLRSGSWKSREKDMTNDDLIVDCCLYFRRKCHKLVVVSADTNLCSNALSQDIPIINPRDDRRWSGKLLARATFDDQADIESIVNHFSEYKIVRRSKRERVALDADLGQQPKPQYSVVDKMDVDDDGFDVNFEPSREHLLDNLHNQMIVHFSSILVELVDRIFSDQGSGSSIHSPLVNLKLRLGDMSECSDCIRFLSDTRTAIFPRTGASQQAAVECIKTGSSRLVKFLTDPYKDGGRKGQEWSRADWYSSLDVLEAIGLVWKDESLLSSMMHLRPQVDGDFATPMRPT